MHLLNYLVFIFLGLLSGCGSALPQSSSNTQENQQSLSSKASPSLFTQDQQLGEEQSPSFECSSLGLSWVRVPTAVLMGQSLRVPDFSHFLPLAARFPHMRPFQSRVLHLESPTSQNIDSPDTHEVYLVWNSRCGEKRIHSTEFQYVRNGRDNRLYTGRSHRLVLFQEANQLWYLPLAKIFSPSEQRVWGVNPSEGDLHQLNLRFLIQDSGWKSLVVYFYLRQGV